MHVFVSLYDFTRTHGLDLLRGEADFAEDLVSMLAKVWGRAIDLRSQLIDPKHGYSAHLGLLPVV